MMKSQRNLRRAALLLVASTPLVLGACSSDDESADTPTTLDGTAPTSTVGSTTPDSTDPGEDGTNGPTVEELLADEPSVSNFQQALTDWLDGDEGRRGVLTNELGITLFVPNNDGFSEEAASEVAADANEFAIFLSEHLVVGAITPDNLGPEESVATGTTYEVGDGSIGSRNIVGEPLQGQNAVIYIIDGPLEPADGTPPASAADTTEPDGTTPPTTASPTTAP